MAADPVEQSQLSNAALDGSSFGPSLADFLASVLLEGRRNEQEKVKEAGEESDPP